MLSNIPVTSQPITTNLSLTTITSGEPKGSHPKNQKTISSYLLLFTYYLQIINKNILYLSKLF